jgi:hypothetical protein
MTIETPSQISLHRTSLFRRPDPSPARGELVWNEEGAVATVAAQGPREAIAVVSEDLDVESAPQAVAADASASVIDATTALPASGLAERRAAGFEHLDAEIRARRAELMQGVERQRAEAEQRIAEAERLEREAIAQRREETDRFWSTEQPRNFAERLNGALTAEIVETRRRYEAAEVELQAELELRRREEAARLEAWHRSEQERILAELAVEEQRFSDRLLRQLKEFEFQLGERQREEEQRLAQWWDEAEQLARQRIAALLDEMLSKKALIRTQ